MVYAMQLIQGHCFKTLQLYSRFYTCIDDEDKKRFHFLTDHQFETLLEKKYGITSGEINTIIEDGVTIVGQFFPKKARNLQKALDFFGKNGFYHTDLHSGNIMMDRG